MKNYTLSEEDKLDILSAIEFALEDLFVQEKDTEKQEDCLDNNVVLDEIASKIDLVTRSIEKVKALGIKRKTLWKTMNR